ncbi:MAG TPA: hypothetical protein VE888_01100 [Streptosporangiaceae bacterium]|nr:hypothetical protein [Streptosporangiaceae bacterium]
MLDRHPFGATGAPVPSRTTSTPTGTPPTTATETSRSPSLTGPAADIARSSSRLRRSARSRG